MTLESLLTGAALSLKLFGAACLGTCGASLFIGVALNSFKRNPLDLQLYLDLPEGNY